MTPELVLGSEIRLFNCSPVARDSYQADEEHDKDLL